MQRNTATAVMPKTYSVTITGSGRRNQINADSNKQKLAADSMNSLSCLTNLAAKQKVMPDDHSKLVPLLPIPNRTVKRLRADDSADSRVKVGHRQAFI